MAALHVNFLICAITYFHHSIDPEEVIQFIEQNFDLSEKTGGFVSIRSRLETTNTLETAQQIL